MERSSGPLGCLFASNYRLQPFSGGQPQALPCVPLGKAKVEVPTAVVARGSSFGREMARRGHVRTKQMLGVGAPKKLVGVLAAASGSDRGMRKDPGLGD